MKKDVEKYPNSPFKAELAELERKQDNNGNTIIIPVKIDGKGTYNNVYIDENQILSVYGKNNLQNYLTRNNYQKIYQKKGTTLNERVQFPDISDSSIDSISRNHKNTTEIQQNSLSDSAIAPEPAGT